jgi:predicted acetyltransferase
MKLAKPYASCRKRSHWFAAVSENGEVMGVGALDPKYGDRDNGGWLGPTFVNKDFRGKGVQAELISIRLILARELELSYVESATDVDNSASLRNMLNAGFRTKYFDHNHNHIVLEWTP